MPLQEPLSLAEADSSELMQDIYPVVAVYILKATRDCELIGTCLLGA